MSKLMQVLMGLIILNILFGQSEARDVEMESGRDTVIPIEVVVTGYQASDTQTPVGKIPVYGATDNSGPEVVGISSTGRPLYYHGSRRSGGFLSPSYAKKSHMSTSQNISSEHQYKDSCNCDCNCPTPETVCTGAAGSVGALTLLGCIIGPVIVPPILAVYSDASLNIALASAIIDLLTGNVFACIPAFMYWYGWRHDGVQDEMFQDWNIGLTAVNTALYGCCLFCMVGGMFSK